MTDRIDQAAGHIPALRYAARLFRDHGVHLLLHNHDVDLKETEGLCVFNFLLNNVPELEVQLDLGWAAYAGRDCIKAMEQYRDRLRLLHFKDMWTGSASKKPHFSVVGEGILPLSDIMEKAADLELLPVGLIIDQDDSEGDLMADVLAGAEHIRSARHWERPEELVYYGKLPLSLMSFPMAGEVTKHTMSAEEICEMASVHGINRLDMMEMELLVYGKNKVKSALKTYGMSLNCLIATVPKASSSEPLIRFFVRKHLKRHKNSAVTS